MEFDSPLIIIIFGIMFNFANIHGNFQLSDFTLILKSASTLIQKLKSILCVEFAGSPNCCK